jgi:hypothetical protein
MPEEHDVQQTGLPTIYLWLAFRLHNSRQTLRHYIALYLHSETTRYACQVVRAKPEVPGKQGCTLTLPLIYSL